MAAPPPNRRRLGVLAVPLAALALFATTAFAQPPLGRATQPAEYNEYTCEKCRNVMQGKTPPRSCSKCGAVFSHIVDEQGNTTITTAGALSGVRWVRALFVLVPLLIGAVGLVIRLLSRGGSSDSPRPRRPKKFKPKPRLEADALPVADQDDEPAPKRKPIRAQTVADAGFEVVEDAPPRRVAKARPVDAGFEVVEDAKSLPRARRRDS